MLRFDGLTHRTAKLNKAAALINLITKELRGNKKGNDEFFEHISGFLEVLGRILEKIQLLEELEKFKEK